MDGPLTGRGHRRLLAILERRKRALGGTLAHTALPAAVLVAALVAACSPPTGSAAPTPSIPAASITAPAGGTPIPADWKRFSSDKYGFQFQYPRSCEVAESEGSLHLGSRIELAVLHAKGLSLSDYVAKFVDDKLKDGTWRVESTTNGSIAGREAITIEYRFGGQGRYGTATFALRQPEILVWGLTAGGFSCDEPDIYSAVLGSFRFSR